jgi:hypothetical protein
MLQFDFCARLILHRVITSKKKIVLCKLIVPQKLQTDSVTADVVLGHYTLLECAIDRIFNITT